MKKYLAIPFAAALSIAALPAGAETATVDPATISAASTPAQHESLAAQYREMANEARGHARHHQAMGQNYKGDKWKGMAEHCERLSKLYADQAAEYEALATAHAGAAKP